MKCKCYNDDFDKPKYIYQRFAADKYYEYWLEKAKIFIDGKEEYEHIYAIIDSQKYVHRLNKSHFEKYFINAEMLRNEKLEKILNELHM